jgi:hypothetical protein
MMVWRCPGCRLPLHQVGADRVAKRKVTYRCHVCRLDLVVDWNGGRLIVREAERPRWREKAA